jgi:ribonuclease HII
MPQAVHAILHDSRRLIAGVDEAGRGPLAGPVVAAAVVFPDEYVNPEITDSKQLSEQERERLYPLIQREAVQWAIAAVGPRRIERLNIREASRVAMKLVVAKISAELVLVDGNTPIDISLPQKTVVAGDSLHVQISAASILAKVWRDRLMKQFAIRYPGYGFEQHMGYATAQHRKAIERLGPCLIHRCTFQGVKEHSPRFRRCFPEPQQLSLPLTVGAVSAEEAHAS